MCVVTNSASVRLKQSNPNYEKSYNQGHQNLEHEGGDSGSSTIGSYPLYRAGGESSLRQSRTKFSLGVKEEEQNFG